MSHKRGHDGQAACCSSAATLAVMVVVAAARILRGGHVVARGVVQLARQRLSSRNLSSAAAVDVLAH